MKKKVLIVTESISYGGLNLASVLFQRYLNPELFECSFCVRRDAVGELENEVTEKGIKVIHVPDSELGYIKSYHFYKRIMKETQYDIVHCHLPFVSGIVLLAAKQCGVEKRIAHAHFSQPYTDTAIYSKAKQLIAIIYRRVMKILLKYYCNAKLACSRASGEYLFGKEEFKKRGILINNGIVTEDFYYDTLIRDKVRAELGINPNTVVLGHIGQFYSVKNQSYVVDVFKDFQINHNDSKLLLVGDGTDKSMIEKKISDYKLKSDVLLLGLRNDANRLYQAMDCFIFPSIHEGFPLTLIEAQASKLPCLVSDTVTRETKLNSNVEYMSINLPPQEWAEKIDEIIAIDRNSVNNSKVIEEFNIKNIAKKLERIYLEGCK